ncbi:hypothetical protein GCM10011515_26380 [Tsuneonella deserti]|uniref:Uncharacterized protein n=1 Tax=Tsuneonella deserti TaxID=2035528 RepID=A0ABQ1SAY4_9SPHN|nr:hypothetical protein [Tsuneonella deserti]GGE05559.1 hypothetical protein GCM10011515_26380 [Tsuneonella deserti]
MLRNLAMITAAATLTVAPVAAQAASPARASAPAAGESDLRSGDAWRALIIVLIGAIGMGFLLLTDNDDAPVSP